MTLPIPSKSCVEFNLICQINPHIILLICSHQVIITPPWRRIYRRLEWRVSKLARRQKTVSGTAAPCPQSCTWGRAQDRTRPETSLLSHTGLGVCTSSLCGCRGLTTELQQTLQIGRNRLWTDCTEISIKEFSC